MPNSYVLDAHALIWQLEGNPKLGAVVETALELITRGEPVALLTKDANITASGLVPVVW